MNLERSGVKLIRSSIYFFVYIWMILWQMRCLQLWSKVFFLPLTYLRNKWPTLSLQLPLLIPFLFLYLRTLFTLCSFQKLLSGWRTIHPIEELQLFCSTLCSIQKYWTSREVRFFSLFLLGHIQICTLINYFYMVSYSFKNLKIGLMELIEIRLAGLMAGLL